MNGVTFRNVKAEISIDGGSNWTNISGQTNSLTIGGGDREIGTFFDAASDVPTLGAGKRAELELSVRVKYTETDAEAQGILAAAYENATEVMMRYAPKGDVVGARTYTTSAGYVKTNPYTGQEVENGDPLRLEFTIVIPSRATYAESLLALFGSDIVAYWPLNELTGSVVNDRSGNARNGTYTGATLDNADSLANSPVPLFTGTASYATLYSTSFRDAFPYNEGTVMGFIKTDSSFWDGSGGVKQLIVFSNASESWKLYRPASANNLQCLTTINASVKSSTVTVNPTSEWTHFAITWNAATNSLKFYYNYVSLGVESGTLGTWAGQLTGAYLATLQTSIQFYTGNMSDVAVINREITQEEIDRLKFPQIKKITVLGDSISASAFGWVPMLSQQYLSGANGAKNRASGGATVITDMSGQVAAAASDNSDVIIIALGANDDNAGDMTAFRAAYESGLYTLRASNPNAEIHIVNIWPLWEVDLTTPKEKGNIRSTLASIAADQNIPIFEPFSEAWYTGAETTDGVHPIASGTAHQSIATHVLAGL